MNKKVKKGLIITAITLVTLVVLIIAFISPIAKYLVEKYDVKYLGREIKIGWMYLNPFTGYAHLKNVKIYEEKSDSVFLTAEGLSADFQMSKLLSKTYEINQITLTKPVAYIIQNRKEFNFNDLITRFTPKDKDTTVVKPPLHFNILNIAIKDGEFHYIEQTIPINYYIKKVNIESSGKWWNVDSMNIKFALQSGPTTGDIKGEASINFDNSRYRLATIITHYDLGLINQYLKDLSNYGNVSAFLDADIKATGGMKDQLDMNGDVFVEVSKFHFGKKVGDDFASFDKLVIDAPKINPKNFTYYMDSIMLSKLFFKYEQYDKLNNIERMFGIGGSKIKKANAENDAGKFNLIIEIANFVKVIAKNFLKSYYKIDKVAVYDANIKFNDFKLREKFSVAANPLNLHIDSIDKNKERFTARLSSGIKPYGSLAVSLSLDPNNYGNFDINYNLKHLPASMVNPYLVTFTSFPLDKGTIDFDGKMHVADSIITSENHLLVLDPRVARRIKKGDTKWIPVPFIMSIVRSSGNAIDFNVPIAGNLNDPKFKLWGVVGQVITNIFVKPPSSAYLYKVKQVEQEVEKALSLKWQMRQMEMLNLQEKFVGRMADFLADNPEESLTITPINYEEKEKENILYYEAKLKYYLHFNKMKSSDMSERDSSDIEKLSVKDEAFVKYIDNLVRDSMLFTLQEKCMQVIGQQTLNNKYAQLLKNREKLFKSYFGQTANRVKFNANQSTVPFNGFSYYKIEYKGDMPERLLAAYEDLEDLNKGATRLKYKDKRKVRRDLVKAAKEAKAKDEKE